MTWAVEAATTQADCAALNSNTTATQWIMEHPQMPYPDHHPTSKTHWMKRMSDTKSTDEDNHDRLYFGGAPAVRDIKMLYEWGVDAVLNVAPNTNAAKVMGVQPLPTGAEEAKIAAEAGILYYAIDAGADLDSPDTSAKVAAFLDFALKETGYLSKAAAGKFVNGELPSFLGRVAEYSGREARGGRESERREKERERERRGEGVMSARLGPLSGRAALPMASAHVQTQAPPHPRPTLSART